MVSHNHSRALPALLDKGPSIKEKPLLHVVCQSEKACSKWVIFHWPKYLVRTMATLLSGSSKLNKRSTRYLRHERVRIRNDQGLTIGDILTFLSE